MFTLVTTHCGKTGGLKCDTRVPVNKQSPEQTGIFSVLLCLAPGVCIVFCRRLSLIAICWLGDASQDIDLQLSLIISGQILPSACCMLETRAYPISRIHPVDLHCTAVPTKYNSYWTQVLNRTKNIY